MPNETYNFQENEEEILKFWQEEGIFDLLRQKNQGKKRWSFLDGPITANNPMGVHHAWGRTLKDLYQRYHAMQGFDQRYQNGFDCQGLWVEVGVEKELGFNNKADIEKYGIANFVEKCKARVRKYSKIQEKQSIKLGQWMDWPNSYYTYSDENNYAIWHFLKKCYDQKYIYKGHDVVPWCARCGTAISEHEIMTEEYKNITHTSLFLKFPIKDQKNEYLLVWTTTPWTLLANVAVAVNPDYDYLKIKQEDNIYYLLSGAEKNLINNYHILEKLKGSKLLGLKYSGPFDDFEKTKSIDHRVVPFLDVNDKEGTGLVHIAPGCGAEDFGLSKEHHLTVIDPVDGDANYLEGFGNYSKLNIKEATPKIIDDLKKRDFIYKTLDYTHRYPTCWRCKSELIFRLVDEWYISMDHLREPMKDIAKKIEWLPKFGEYQELDWLKNMSDWMISKKRYWGLALPIYECDCGHFEVIGSKDELKSKAVEGWQDFDGHSPHRPWIDKIKIKCSKCGQIISRIPDVGNPWLDAGIVPYSTMRYFEDKKYWQNWFPADFICESFPGQFRNWFYSLIAMSTVMENKVPFKNVLGHATVRDEKGEEMHKSKGNAIMLDEAIDQVGADPIRWLYVSNNPFSNLKFGYHVIEDGRKKLLVLTNLYKFFNIYAKINHWSYKAIDNINVSKNKLDLYILAKNNQVIKEVTESLDQYKHNQASTILRDYWFEDLSTWYLRLSRKRKDLKFYHTLYKLLLDLLIMLAPILPFMSESLFQELRKNFKLNNLPKSIHLMDWPKAQITLNDEKHLSEMALVKEAVSISFAQRMSAGIKVRQPLNQAEIFSPINLIEYEEIIKNEMNVKNIKFIDKKEKLNPKAKNLNNGNLYLYLDAKISKELHDEGLIRELSRQLQNARKEAGYSPSDKIILYIVKIDSRLKTLVNNSIYQEYLRNRVQLENIIFTFPDKKLSSFDLKVNHYQVNVMI